MRGVKGKNFAVKESFFMFKIIGQPVQNDLYEPNF